MAPSRLHRPTRRPAPTLEALESRVVPYATTGNAWPAPQLITLSFMPDGTTISTSGTQLVGSNLFAKFNAKFGSAATWQNVILKAAQVWAQQTNINFAVVSDDGAAIGTGPDQQGDPNHGDIRIGGYVYGNSILAMAEMPPPANNYDIAGDIQFNTGQYFNIGYTYDLFSVAAHEIGHALGLGHSTSYTALMYGAYDGAKQGPSSDDIAGIRAIYSNGNPRTGDGGTNNSIATATDLTSQLDPINLTALLTGRDIATTSTAEYYTVTAPALTSSTLTVGVQSSGLSLLSPKVTVYAADGVTVLGSATTGQYGATLSVTINNVTAGAQYYVKVAGANTTAFGTGAYALTLNFGTSSLPTVPLPNTTLANGNPTVGGGGTAQVPGADDSHVDAFPDPDAGTVAVVSARTSSPAAATPDAGTVSILTAAGPVRSATLAYTAPSAEQFAPRVYAPSAAEFGRTGTTFGAERLTAAGVIDVTPGERVEDDTAGAPGTEKYQPAPQGESNPAPIRSEIREAPPAEAAPAIPADEVQAADVLFTTAEPLSSNPADPTGDTVQGGGSALLLFGEAVVLAALQGSYRAAADKSQPEEERRKPQLAPRS